MQCPFGHFPCFEFKNCERVFRDFVFCQRANDFSHVLDQYPAAAGVEFPVGDVLPGEVLNDLPMAEVVALPDGVAEGHSPNETPADLVAPLVGEDASMTEDSADAVVEVPQEVSTSSSCPMMDVVEEVQTPVLEPIVLGIPKEKRSSLRRGQKTPLG